VRGTGPSVDVKSWIVCWCVCIGVGIGSEDSPAFFDLSGAACNRQSLVFWCRSGIRPALGDSTPPMAGATEAKTKESRGTYAANIPTPMQTHQQAIHDLTFTEGLVPLTPPSQPLRKKSAVLCTQRHHLWGGESHKESWPRQTAQGASKTTPPAAVDTSATRHPRIPPPSHRALAFCAPYTHPLPPTTMLCLSYGFVGIC
jgi:hypothetical protein